jgi:hypothetical protein
VQLETAISDLTVHEIPDAKVYRKSVVLQVSSKNLKKLVKNVKFGGIMWMIHEERVGIDLFGNNTKVPGVVN